MKVSALLRKWARAGARGFGRKEGVLAGLRLMPRSGLWGPRWRGRPAEVQAAGAGPFLVNSWGSGGALNPPAVLEKSSRFGSASSLLLRTRQPRSRGRAVALFTETRTAFLVCLSVDPVPAASTGHRLLPSPDALLPLNLGGLGLGFWWRLGRACPGPGSAAEMHP